MIPRAQVGIGFNVRDLHYKRDIHVANCTDSYGAWRNCQQTIDGLLCPAIAQITLRALVLQIELEVICKVEVPAQFEKLIKKEGLLPLFEKLSYTHRKEYCRWITEAKKEETRLKRLRKAIEMLKKGMSTPG